MCAQRMACGCTVFVSQKDLRCDEGMIVGRNRVTGTFDYQIRHDYPRQRFARNRELCMCPRDAKARLPPLGGLGAWLIY
jgi:hypothetical protein